MNYEKVILSTDCDAGLNVLWKWFKEKKTRKTKRKKYSLTALKFSIFMERNDVSLAGRLKPIQ